MLTMLDVQAGAARFHAEHNALHPDNLLDVIAEDHPLYLSVLIHDYLHFFFGFSTEEEDLLACIECRLSTQCTSLEYLKEYTDKLPVDFITLYNLYS